jgi:hypothetical protein
MALMRYTIAMPAAVAKYVIASIATHYLSPSFSTQTNRLIGKGNMSVFSSSLHVPFLHFIVER